jgi:DNA-directed RNA polymerase specialized sigma24 family protein
MTEAMLGRGDPVIRRLQQAFAHEDPAADLAAVSQRATRHQAGDPVVARDSPTPDRGLTAADLAAAGRREPAAVTRLYTAYAPALFRFFMAAVGDRHLAEDLTGNVFVSAIEGLPRFRGPVEAVGGWLFQIARHDLYDHRRRQARSRVEPLEENLGEAALAAGAGASVIRLSPREREILGLLADGRSTAEIGRELYVSTYTVRTHMQNILQKLEMQSKQEVAAAAREHGWPFDDQDSEELAIERLEGSRVVFALRQLSPDQREVLLLRMVGGLTAPEVAAVLGKSTGAVKALQHRGLASLTRVLRLRGLEMD